LRNEYYKLLNDTMGIDIEKEEEENEI